MVVSVGAEIDSRNLPGIVDLGGTDGTAGNVEVCDGRRSAGIGGRHRQPGEEDRDAPGMDLHANLQPAKSSSAFRVM